eukprot:gene2573-30959_t
MADIKDILGVSRTPAPGRPADGKQKKEKWKKPERPQGMSREAFALLDDSHPIISSQFIASSNKGKDAKAVKPKANTKGIPTWQWRPFKNSARSDGLGLFRWNKGYKDINGRMREPDDADYFYAKFNKKVQMLRYSEEEWESIIKGDSGDWTRHETDYLFDLCDRFDLRFSVIADRYEFASGPARSIDEMKERYYYVARKLLIAREGSEGSVSNHPLILGEARKIEERYKAEAATAAAAAGHSKKAATPAGRTQSGSMAATPTTLVFPANDFKNPLEYANVPEPGVPSLFDADMVPTKPPKPGVYGRGSASISLALAMTNSLGVKGSKSVEQMIQDIGWMPALYGPKCNSRAVTGSWLALRSEIVALVELRRMVHSRLGGGDANEKKSAKGSKKRPLGS